MDQAFLGTRASQLSCMRESAIGMDGWLFIVKGVDRIHLRGLVGGIQTEKQSDLN